MAVERDKAKKATSELSRLAEAHAQAQAENKTLKEALNKPGKVPSVSGNQSVLDVDKALGESLKPELAELRRSMEAFVACLILLPVVWCEAGDTAPAVFLPSVAYTAPAAASADMWEKYAEFFGRLREVWTSCPGRSLGSGHIFAAEWLNENTAWYRQILRTCRTSETQGGKRAWPPSLSE